MFGSRSRSLRFAAILSTMLFSGMTASRPLMAEQPNVLFIAIDDLNDWIGVLGGHPQTRTPNLNRLAESSLLFTNAHCAAPACNPSRAALMTGIPPYHSGVYHNSQPWRPALPKAVTLPQAFQQGGYWAAGSGKIYHGPFPDPPSWNEYVPSKQKQTFGDPRPAKTNLNGLNKAHFDWGPIENAADSDMGDAKTADWICSQLAQAHDRPFFLACGFYRPHLPWYVPSKHFERFPLDQVKLPLVREDDLLDVPAAGVKMAKPQGDHAAVIKSGQWKNAVQGYLASIDFVDGQLGRVLDALEKGPNAADTIVILWTDHGWHLGEKQHWRKFALWERATRVPLMIRVPPGLVDGIPNGTPAGARCPVPVSLMDIYPTLADLCGIPANDRLTGDSLRRLLVDPASDWDRAVVTTFGRNNHAVRDRRWRYIRYADGSEELYDHQRDPHEWTNLASDPQFTGQKKRLAKWLPSKNAAEVPAARGRAKAKRSQQRQKKRSAT